MLVIVMQPSANTTVEQIAGHLQPYAAWLNQRLNGGLKLSGILVISHTEYLESIKAAETLGSEAFLNRGVTVQI